MKTTIIKDTQKKRIIVKDYESDTLTIKGDFATSSISGYAVYHRYDDKIYYISIIRKTAEDYCEYLNKKECTDTYYICEKTIFV